MIDLYTRAVGALANLIYSISDPLDGNKVGIVHINENNLNAVPDMLARLGVMEEFEIHHEFVNQWQPEQELKLVRHLGEPTILDIHDGLEFCSIWYRQHYQITARAKAAAFAREKVEAIRNESRKANQKLSWLVRPERDWTGSEGDDGMDLLEAYWSRRREKVEELDGKESALYPNKVSK